MARKIYRVLPHPDGGWQVKISQGGRAIKIHRRKFDALDHARELARANEPAQVFVHKSDGKIESQYKYGNEKKPAAKKTAATKASAKKAVSGKGTAGKSPSKPAGGKTSGRRR